MATTDEKLDDLRKIVQGTHEAVLLLGKDVSYLAQTQAEHSSALWGNGQPGLVTRHQSTERAVSDVPRLISDGIKQHRHECDAAKLVSETRMKAKGFILAMTVVWTILTVIVSLLTPLIRAKLGL